MSAGGGLLARGDLAHHLTFDRVGLAGRRELVRLVEVLRGRLGDRRLHRGDEPGLVEALRLGRGHLVRLGRLGLARLVVGRRLGGLARLVGLCSAGRVLLRGGGRPRDLARDGGELGIGLRVCRHRSDRRGGARGAALGQSLEATLADARSALRGRRRRGSGRRPAPEARRRDTAALPTRACSRMTVCEFGAGAGAAWPATSPSARRVRGRGARPPGSPGSFAVALTARPVRPASVDDGTQRRHGCRDRPWHTSRSTPAGVGRA